MEAKRTGYAAFGFQGTLTVSSPSWDLESSAAEPVVRMVARVRQMLEDGIPVRVLEPRLDFGAAEAAMLQREIGAWCLAHLGTELPVIAAVDRDAMLVVDTRVDQVFDGRGVTVQEVLAVLLSSVDGLQWDTIPKLAAFKPEGAADAIRFTELLDGIFDKI